MLVSIVAPDSVVAPTRRPRPLPRPFGAPVSDMLGHSGGRDEREGGGDEEKVGGANGGRRGRGGRADKTLVS